MLSATAFLADGLDLVVEFLARSAADTDTTTISARYASYAELQQAAQALARWSCGLADAKALRSDAGGLSLSMPRGLWQDLYARALFSGMPTPPDRIGLSSLGAGGMLASLELVLERAKCACAQQAIPWKSHPGLSMADGAPAPDLIAPETFVALEWQPLRDLLLRDAQLRQTVARMARFTGDPLVFAGAMPVEALLIEQSRRPALLICRAQWREAQLAALRQHFLEHALLLFRLLFLDKESGWGLDADSRLLPGFVELMAHSEEIGFLSFGDFADACAGMAGLQEFNPKLDLRAPLHDATRAMLELWPEPYLERNSALAPLYAGWMVQFHPSAHIAADAILEPGVRIRANAIVEAAAVVRAGACLGAGVRLPGGAIVGRNAHIARIELNGVRLPQGTVLHGDLLLHAGAWIRRHVEFGHGAEIGPGVVIREGVRVGARPDTALFHRRTGRAVARHAGRRQPGDR